MKVLFLDIDGVLNSYGSRNRAGSDFATHKAWLESAVSELKRIQAETHCFIVISSDWRLQENILRLREGWIHFSLPGWLSTTPVLGLNNIYNFNRGKEIKAWLTEAGTQVETFAILDDNPWMLPEQEGNFVRTEDWTGLTKHDADKVISILNGNLC